MKYIFSLSSIIWMIIVCIFFSILPERIAWLGKPEFGTFRFILSGLILALCFTLIVRPKPSWKVRVRDLPYILSLFLIILYEYALLAFHNINYEKYFLFYALLFFVGYYFLGSAISTYIKKLFYLGVISGFVGWIFWMLGPSALESVGIGAINRFWGQNAVLSGQGTFRSYSLFSDHQAFSAFIQFVGLALRIEDYQKCQKKNIAKILAATFFSIPTLSTTGFLWFTVLFVSYLPKFTWAILLVVATLFFKSIMELNNSFFHSESLIWRAIFIRRQLQALQISPRLSVSNLGIFSNESGGFTSDCFFLTSCYIRGTLWGCLYIANTFSLLIMAGKKRMKPAFLIILYVLVNVLTNGLPFQSMPLLVICPIYIGLMMRYLVGYPTIRRHSAELLLCTSQSCR